MWIEIKDDIFNSIETTNFTHLLRIIFEKPLGSLNNRANLFGNIDKIIESTLFNKLNSIDQKLIEESIKLFAYEENIEKKYVVSNNGEENYNLNEAIAFFNEPLWIVLENSMNDSNLLKSIIYHFDDEKSYLKDCIKNRWIDFANAGGSGAKNQIKGKLSTYDNLASLYGTKNEKYYRGIVILDSDREYPTQPPKDYNNLIFFLNSKKIDYHILEKRAMENYMPDEVIDDIKLKKIKSHKPEDKTCIKWVDVYKYLDDSQKNFLKFEGIKKKFEDLDINIQNLYKNQAEVNYNLLSEGISYRDNETNGIDEDERRFKNSFPKLFVTSSLVNKATLEKRAGNDELERIYTKIRAQL